MTRLRTTSGYLPADIIVKMRKLKIILYWLVSLSWGLPMTLLGAVVALALILTGHRPKRFYYNLYFELGERWGGSEFGGFFVVNKNPSIHILRHEAGHGLQNLMLGFFMPFLVCIPSAIRYWVRRFQYRYGKRDFSPYDSVWFEGWATRLGRRFFS